MLWRGMVATLCINFMHNKNNEKYILQENSKPFLLAFTCLLSSDYKESALFVGCFISSCWHFQFVNFLAQSLRKREKQKTKWAYDIFPQWVLSLLLFCLPFKRFMSEFTQNVGKLMSYVEEKIDKLLMFRLSKVERFGKSTSNHWIKIIDQWLLFGDK